ncbi:MAG: PAS domain S-box protein [Sulfuritalea sp.]|nr:PAS domain S-box protein [Sulfuritalea sp.]
MVYLKHRHVVSCNRRLEEIFGYGPGELIGKSSEVFYDTHQRFETVGEDAYRVAARSRAFSTELILKHKDGTLFRGALNGRVLDPAHPQEGSIWVYADISERHKAEQEIRKLLQALEQSPVSIVITNREGLIEYVNPRFTKVTGFTAEEAIGRNPRILQSGETPREIYEQLWQTLLAGKEWRGVVRNRRKNGELFWEEASMSPILDDKGEVTHYLAVKEDITERKRIEDELEQHRSHLENLVEQRTADLSAALAAAKVADQAKDAFLANVSHELRTPLNAVIGLSELARRISTDPRQQDYLDKVTGAGKSLAGIINDLLDLSKISADRMELEAKAFGLRALIQRSRSVMAHRATEKGLELIEEIDDAVPDVLVGDPLRIEQILLNLLSNAIKFTPAGHVRLRISLHARAETRAGLNIDVEDTGIGLAEESIARLFQPFAQADASMNRKFGGTGLGLALCKRLAEMMDGNIRVTSREGAGTTFHVRIWLGVGDADQLV